MKKLIALTLCLLLALAALPVLGETLPAEETPAPGETAEPQAPTDPLSPMPEPRPEGGSEFVLDVNGETVRLAYDGSPQYSSVAGGLVQASYYGYGADGATMYELYIIFPDNTRSGMVITPEYVAMTGEESSVVLIQSSADRELYYYSSLMNGSIYPTGSTFSIAIDSAEVTKDSAAFTGRLSAELVALDTISGEVAATLSIPETPFDFTIGGAYIPSPGPQPTPAPEDMRKA